MKIDYRFYAIKESADMEVCKEFIRNLKTMDSDLASARLLNLLNGNTEAFYALASFNALKEHITSADEFVRK